MIHTVLIKSKSQSGFVKVETRIEVNEDHIKELVLKLIEAVLNAVAEELVFEGRTLDELPTPAEPLICKRCGNVSGMLWNGLCAEKCAAEQNGFSTFIDPESTIHIN